MAGLTIAAFASLIVWVSRPEEPKPRDRALAAYARGLGFLAGVQRDSGEFPTFYWRMDEPEKTTYVASVFTASQVLYSLAWGQLGETGQRVSDRTAAYLLAQQEPPGVWRYYGKGARQVLSPDVDDTSVALAALALQGHPIAPEALDALRASRNGTGLFNTWIGDPSTWVGVDSRDTDLVVNLNALMIFALAGQTVDEVCARVVADSRGPGFPRPTVYYPSSLAFTYALSRAYADGDAKCLADAMPRARNAALSSQQADGGWGNDLETAFALLTLLNAGYRGDALDRGIAALLARQAPDGGWALAPAYRAAVLPINYGSRALTTAVCLEALGKYLRH